MNSDDLKKIVDKIKQKASEGKDRLEKNMPEIESKITTYAQKIGIKPQDIEKAKQAVRTRIEKFQDKK